ncbi:MAG: nucleotidyltransferase [Calditrichaeota bacterium]|nr:MAG: nucleotidyltransferase [Calditrichota bacterium]
MIQIPQKEIEALCKKWKIDNLSLFGSALRKDFSEKSDVDLLFTFSKKVRYGFFELSKIQMELEKLLGRNVDLVSKKGIEASRNHLRREEILKSARVIYEER